MVVMAEAVVAVMAAVAVVTVAVVVMAVAVVVMAVAVADWAVAVAGSGEGGRVLSAPLCGYLKLPVLGAGLAEPPGQQQPPRCVSSEEPVPLEHSEIRIQNALLPITPSAIAPRNVLGPGRVCPLSRGEHQQGSNGQPSHSGVGSLRD